MKSSEAKANEMRTLMTSRAQPPFVLFSAIAFKPNSVSKVCT